MADQPVQQTDASTLFNPDGTPKAPATGTPDVNSTPPLPPTDNGTNSSPSTATPGVTPSPLTTGDPSLNNTMASLANNPTLPAAGVVTPVAQQVQSNELVQNTPITAPAQATAPVINPPPAAVAGQGVAQSQSSTPEQAAQTALGSTDTYTASLLGGQGATATAAQGAVTTNSTVQGQLDQLMNFDSSTEPAWARGAAAVANDQLAARGMGASSIAGSAVVQAIMQAGLPIAQADAATYAQMNLANLTNQQQANIQTSQNNQAAMLSDQAATNAAAQFNAQNTTQVGEFFANLMSSIDQFNVTQANAMTTANASQTTQANIANLQSGTQVAVANAANAAAVSQFNATQANAMTQFYANNQLVVDQSNATWRRDVNTANTAAENSANQTNATNLLNISNTALNNLWQASRDQAGYVFTSSQNQAAIAGNMAVAALNANTQFGLLSQEQQNAMLQGLGNFALSLFSSSSSTPDTNPGTSSLDGGPPQDNNASTQ